MEIGRVLPRGGTAAGVLARMFATVFAWLSANIAPLVLIPLAALFVWVAIWRVWLPRPGGGSAVTRAVTTVDANAGTRPTHKVTTVVKTSARAVPSRRSETLVLALLFLGAGVAIVGVFNHRISGIELDKDGIKVTLNQAEKAGAAELVDRLAQSGAGSRTLARGLRRYLGAVASRRRAEESRMLTGGGAQGEQGLTADQAQVLALRIADDLL